MRLQAIGLDQVFRYWDASGVLAHNPLKSSIFRRHALRFLSAAVRPFSNRTIEAYDVPVGSNGHVKLTVTRPLAFEQQSTRPNVILYLPPGPVFRPSNSRATKLSSGSYHPGNEDDGQNSQCIVADATSSIVVTVNYRLGTVREVKREIGKEPQNILDPQLHTGLASTSDRRFMNTFYMYPTPVHDTLAGFDWILQTLEPAHLGILGSHVGGSLALMLGLTEAKTIRTIAAIEPICDWAGLDEHCLIAPEVKTVWDDRPIENDTSTKKQGTGTQRARKRGPNVLPDLVPLLEAREKLFASPERYFDAFASPILFLRSAGKHVPKIFSKYLTGTEHSVPVLRYSEVQEDSAFYSGEDTDFDDIPPRSPTVSNGASVCGLQDFDLDRLSGTEFEKVIRRRKALSRWPPYGLVYGLDSSSPRLGIGRLQMTLPWTRVFVRADDKEVNDLNCDDDVNTPKDRHVSKDIKSTLGPKRRRQKASTVLARQAEEMVSVMRRACFFGREINFAESRVQLIRVPVSKGLHHDLSTRLVEEKAAAWLNQIFHADDESEE